MIRVRIALPLAAAGWMSLLGACVAVVPIMMSTAGAGAAGLAPHKAVYELKLAKSTGATSLRRLREGGAKPADIRRMVGLG